MITWLQGYQSENLMETKARDDDLEIKKWYTWAIKRWYTREVAGIKRQWIQKVESTEFDTFMWDLEKVSKISAGFLA